MQLRVDFKSGNPVYLQLVEQIKAAAASGAVRHDETLPAIGALAEQLRVSRNNVAKAYAELEAAGIIELLPEKGYRLKEHHRPLRKEISRTQTAAAAPRTATRRRAVTATLTYSLLTFLLAALYFAIVIIVGVILVRTGVVRGEVAAVVATVIVAAISLPLRNRLQQALSQVVFPKREHVPKALQSLKSALWSEPDLDSLLESVAKTCKDVTGVRPEVVRDHSEVMSLVNSFPALRSAREPVSAGNDLLMPLFSHDEVIGVLRLVAKEKHHNYDAEDWQLLTGIGEQVALAANQFSVRNVRLESEYAFDIQRGLLPREIPQVPGFHIAGAWQPAKTVGGDYYDVFPIGDSAVALIIADVSGKGMPAALLMSNLQATTKAYASIYPSPRELCARVNRAICESISAGKFITFFYAILDAREHLLTYTNAGHNPPLIVSRDGNCRKLEAGGMVLGVFPGAEYEQACIELREGDRLVIFTDGVIEAADSSEKEFGDERLFTVMTSSPDVTATQLRDSIMEAVTRFCRGDFSDDVTLLTIVADGASESR